MLAAIFLCISCSSSISTIDSKDVPRFFTSIQNSAVYAMTFSPDGRVLVAVGALGTIDASSDVGKNWSRVGAFGRGDLHDVVVDKLHRTLTAVGDEGAIFSSLDQGLTWNRIAAPTVARLLRIVYSPHNDELIVVGEGETVLRSRDGGRSWEPIKPVGRSSYVDVATSPSTGTIIVVGNDGSIVRSPDSGATWMELASGVWSSSSPTIKTKSGSVLMVSEEGRILRSVDGTAWSFASGSDEENRLEHLVYDRRHSICVAQTTTRSIRLSRDEGQTWSEVELALGGVDGVASDPDRGIIVAIGGDGQIARSTDGGAHWDASTKISGIKRFGLNRLTFAPNSSYFIASQDALIIARSQDGGATWLVVPPDPKKTYFGVDLTTGDNCCAGRE
jgi:photosystem II stability/assembly factor-like uncharacterized protein